MKSVRTVYSGIYFSEKIRRTVLYMGRTTRLRCLGWDGIQKIFVRRNEL